MVMHNITYLSVDCFLWLLDFHEQLPEIIILIHKHLRSDSFITGFEPYHMRRKIMYKSEVSTDNLENSFLHVYTFKPQSFSVRESECFKKSTELHHWTGFGQTKLQQFQEKKKKVTSFLVWQVNRITVELYKKTKVCDEVTPSRKCNLV